MLGPGAVTSPTILPPISLPTSSSIGPPGLYRSDDSIDHSLPTSGGDCTLNFDKEKQPDASCAQIEDLEAEAEAEAAASAIAVAAISSDDLAVNGLGASSVSVSDSKSFGGADMPALPSGCGKIIHATWQSIKYYCCSNFMLIASAVVLNGFNLLQVWWVISNYQINQEARSP